MSNELTIRNCTFAFKCNARWEKLEQTENDEIRFCDDCQKEVFLCLDDDILVKNVMLNRCVAIYKSGYLSPRFLVPCNMIQASTFTDLFFN